MSWPAPSPGLILENEAVIISPLTPSLDGEELFEAASIITNSTDIFAFSLAAGPFCDLSSFLRYLEKKAGSPGELPLKVYSKRLGCLVGAFSLLRITPVHGTLEVGSLWYTQIAQRTEINTNTMFLLFSYVFETLGYRRLEWKCHNENKASKKAALRLGFTWEGLFRNHFWDKGRNRDTAWFSIIDDDWPSVKGNFQNNLLVPRANPSGPLGISEIFTPRLRLRPVTPEDGEAVFQLYSDPRVCEYYDQSPFTTLAQGKTHLERWLQGALEKTQFRYALVFEGRMIGTCGLYALAWHQNRGTLGFDLLPEFQRRGLMAEALTGFLPHCQDALGLNRIQALVLPEHQASRRVLERTGFQNEGLLRCYEKWEDKGFVDLLIYGKILHPSG